MMGNRQVRCYDKRFAEAGIIITRDKNNEQVSKNLGKKIARIRKSNRWDDVEKAYLNLKNMYLRRGDKHHPSFIILAEAVNQIYQSIEH